jgi:hypothetical protein
MPVPRVLVASGSIQGVDHERFAANEVIREFVEFKVILARTDVPSNFANWIKGWGGECRLEFILTASLRTDRGILVDVNGKLFEGDSEATSDLAEEKNTSVFVPKGGTVPFSMNLYNSGSLGGGGDSGSISLTLVNRPAEEEEMEEAEAEREPVQIRFVRFKDLARPVR